MTESKAGTVRVSCEDLATQEDGWVEMSAHLKVKHLPYVEALDLRDFEKEWEDLRHSEKGNKVLALRYDLMAAYVTDWGWKSPDGQAYPKPAGNPEAFADLRPAEYKWLWDKIWEVIGEGYGIPKANDTPS